MLKLNVVVGSTRPGRVGWTVAQWFVERAKAHGRFEVVLSDLEEIGLPLLNEPKHPRFGQYEHAHTKAWSATVAASDAFVFVAPEYNHGPSPALVNALDYLYREWNYKPGSFVSYGGVSGGIRAVQITRQLLTALKMVPVVEMVGIPMVTNHVKDGTFVGSEAFEKSAAMMLDELHRWAEALRPMRAG